MLFMLAQLLGLGAFIISLSSMHFSKRRSILLCQVISASLWVVHFYILGAYTGMVLNLVSMARAAIFRKYRTDRGRTWIPVVFCGIFTVASLLTWQGWLSILPLVSMLLSTYGLWQKDTQHIRAVALLSPPLWFVYNVSAGSIAGALHEVALFNSILLAYWRHHRKAVSSAKSQRRRTKQQGVA